VTAAAISDVLAKILPAQGTVLEVASGDGERILHFARTFKHLTWQPSERDPQIVTALAKTCEQASLPNVAPAVELDVVMQPWPVTHADAVVCADFAHLQPFAQTAALFGGGARTLAAGAPLLLCGPFKIHGKYPAKELEDLDQSLRARSPDLGLRDIRELTVAGTRSGLGLEHVVAMPGAHVGLVFRRRALLPPTGQFKVS
jgi:hypothetical protein